MATTEAETYIGKSVPRKEDAKLLTGQSKFIDDLTMTGMVWASIVRSPYAHAKITRVDVTAAREAEGVVAVFSGADLADDWAATLPCVWLVTEDTKQPMHRPLATDKVRYQGDGVAIVIAESRALAKDAAELVEVDYEELPAVIDPEEALADGAPILHDDLGTNHCFTWKLEGGDVEGVFGNAPVTVKERYRQQRLIPNAIEPRGVIATYEPSTDEYTLWSATQIPHILRFWLAIVLGVPESRLRVIAPDVGGGFGSKLNVYAEEALALALAKRIGRPVKWTEERSEGYLATIHGRDQWQEMEYAADEDGKIRGVRAKLVVGLGAYLQLVTAGTPILGGWVYGGPYDIEAYSLEVVGAFTTATPTDAYRGAGRPEATYLIERTIDALARKLDMDPVELRRKNFITEFPYTLASGLTIDSGDFVGALDRALEMVGYEELRAEQAERRSKGDKKELGIGFSTYTEMCGLAPSRILGAILYAAGGWDAATVRCLPTGSVEVFIGTSPHGQGHVTTFSQIVAERLGVPIDQVEVVHGDTTTMQLGLDTYGSRSLAVGGIALYNAAEKVIAKARDVVAHKLEVSPGGSRVRQRHLQGRRHGQVDDRPRRGPARLHRPRPARRHGAGPRGDLRLRPAQLQLAGRRAHLRRRGRHGDGRDRPPPLHRGGRDRQRHQPDGRRRPDTRRHHPGHRAGALGGGDLRRRGQPDDLRRCTNTSSRAPPRRSTTSSIASTRRARRTRSASRAWGRRARSPRRRQ